MTCQELESLRHRCELLPSELKAASIHYLTCARCREMVQRITAERYNKLSVKQRAAMDAQVARDYQKYINALAKDEELHA